MICELKCTLFPSNPYQLYTYYRALKEAAMQAKNKSEFARKNLEFFLNKLDFPLSLDTNERIFPLVISNLTLATGYSFHNVPVVDLKILQDYLNDGQFTLYSQNDGSGWQSSGHEIQLYSSEQEAEEQIEKCLNNLPNIREYQNKIKKTAVPVYLASQNDPIAFQLRNEIDFPQELQ